MQTPFSHLEEHGWRRTIVLPADLRAPLVELARRNERSASAEIRIALRKHLDRASVDFPRFGGHLI